MKTALHGGDPNWGRIAQAVGGALPSTTPLAAGHRDRGRAGVQGERRRAVRPAELAAAVSRDEVEYEVRLPGEGAETEVFFSDLGHGYVTINADYTT